MEFAPRGHGYDGKVHADKWTVEYCGRGNHAADAACFRTTRPVSAREPTVAPSTERKSSTAGEGGDGHGRVTDAAVRALRVFYFETQVLSTTEEEDGDEDDDERLVRRAQLAGGPASRQAPHPYSNGTRAPSWRSRARQLVQTQIQSIGPAVRTDEQGREENEPDEQDEDMETTEAAPAERVGSAWHLFRDMAETNAEPLPPSLPSMLDAGDEDPDMRYYQILTRNGAGNRSTGAGTGSGGAGGSGMHFAFTLSSRTLQHIRSRYERRRLRRSTEKKRFSHRVAVGFSLGALKANGRDTADHHHTKADSESINTGHEDLGQHALSLAYVGKTGRVVCNGQEYLQCEKYGAGDVVGAGIVFDTNTFFFTLNGNLMGMVAATDVHHLDFFVENDDGSSDGWYESEVPMFDFEDREEANGHENDDDDDDECMSDDDTLLIEDHGLYPSVSLHRKGECVRAVFTPSEFKFDLYDFQKQVLKERQRSLGPDSVAVKHSQDEDSVMDALVLDYFRHYGYEDAYKALQLAVEAGAPSVTMDDESMNDVMDHQVKSDQQAAVGSSVCSDEREEAECGSLASRSEIRQLIRSFQTAAAVTKLRALPCFESLMTKPRARRVLLYCRMLCVLDVLQPPVESKHGCDVRSGEYSSNGAVMWNTEKAIVFAQNSFADFAVSRTVPTAATSTISEGRASGEVDVVDSAFQEDLGLFMSLLLYADPSDVPQQSQARMFLTAEFRERVADELNDVLLIALGNDAAFASTQSSLELFLSDLYSLRTMCLRRGCRVFPDSAAAISAQLAATRKRKEQQRRRRPSSSGSDGASNGAARADEDDDDSSSSASDASSSVSSSSSRSDRRRQDDEDD